MMRATVSTQPQIIIVACCITLRRSAYGAWGNYSVHDADGKKNTSASFIGHINPLRYRGYYYDAETGFYYLQSRYYDPAICRFINADTFATTDANGFLSANMFAYCENNPIMRADEDGEIAHIIIEVAIGAAIGAAFDLGTQLLSNGGDFSAVDRGSVITSAVSGAVTAVGGVAVAAAAQKATSFATKMLIRTAGNGVNNVIGDLITGDVKNVADGVKSFGTGAVQSLSSSGIRAVRSIRFNSFSKKVQKGILKNSVFKKGNYYSHWTWKTYRSTKRFDAYLGRYDGAPGFLYRFYKMLRGR